jgi:hypothetical protein
MCNMMMDADDKFQAKQDADTLQAHSEVTNDPARHAAAHAELQDRQKQGAQAVKQSSKAMQARTKKGLGKAFPSSGSTPFEKAAKGGGTPFDKAGQGD